MLPRCPLALANRVAEYVRCHVSRSSKKCAGMSAAKQASDTSAAVQIEVSFPGSEYMGHLHLRMHPCHERHD